jgi:hypothetical protein
MTHEQVCNRHYRSRRQLCPFLRPQVPIPSPFTHFSLLTLTFRYSALVRHMTLINYFPDFLLLLRDALASSQTVAQRAADAKTLQIDIGRLLDTVRYVNSSKANAAIMSS